MDPLRSRLIRLAHSDEALRPHLLPLLRQAAGDEDPEVTLRNVRQAVAKAYRASWRRAISPSDLTQAVLLPKDTGRADEFKRAAVVIFTEYAGLSQYDNDLFWRALERALNPHGLYYDWYDGGSAGIYRG